MPAQDVTVVTDEADNCTTNPSVTFISDVSDGGSDPEIITRTYRVTDQAGNFIDLTQTITVESIDITTQPVDQAVFVNSNATFSVSADNADTYQWQVSTDAGVSFTNIINGLEYSGGQTVALTVNSVDLDKNDHRYRVLVSNSTAGCPVTISNVAILRVQVSTVTTNKKISYRIR